MARWGRKSNFGSPEKETDYRHLFGFFMGNMTTKKKRFMKEQVTRLLLRRCLSRVITGTVRRKDTYQVRIG